MSGLALCRASSRAPATSCWRSRAHARQGSYALELLSAGTDGVGYLLKLFVAGWVARIDR
jgi:hypothetical protein